MARYHDVVVSIRQISRKAPDWSEFHPSLEYAITAGISSLSSRIERTEFDILERLEPGWEIDGPEYSRKLVRVELPEEIKVGEYVVGRNTILCGPYGEYSARDGMGRSVYLYCKKPMIGRSGEAEQVLEATIASGLYASVPVKDGTRTEIALKTVSVSATYKDRLPAGWELTQECIWFSALKRLRISRGMTVADLSEKSGINIRQIQRVELKEAQAGNLTAKNLLALADALGVDPKDLI